MSPPTQPSTNRPPERQLHAAARAVARERGREAERAVNHLLGDDALTPPADPGPPATLTMYLPPSPFAMTWAY